MGNIALFLFCLLAGGFVFWETGTYPPPADASMDAGFYPRVLVCVLFLLATILAVTLIRKRKRSGRFSPGSPPSSASLALVGCMVLYCLLLTVAGYAVATILFVFAVTLLFRGSIKEGAAVSLSATVFLEALFRYGFQVPLPPGMMNLF
ncbi:membrane hypothetical protein [uncultured delta proteobacterium]|uniref:DUF1468 domain-containing protein n=1 Tax=uncultured delta proteobacterium TaxID=34034 RepID=A0A212JF24_9DELT|nr:membrane hypothetical protein [uncultured delta proteobacterium]